MSYTRHIAAVAVASGVVVASLAGPAVAKSSAPTTTDPAAAAAGYLAGQLIGKHHDHYNETFGSQVFGNYGETADAVLSMDAAGVAQTAAARATVYLKKNAASYAGGVPTDYPGSAGKLLLVAEAQKINPRTFGALNLIAALKKSLAAGDASGEYQQNPGFSGPSYVVSQALPVLALANLPHGKAPKSAVSFLAKQQCKDGGYQTEIRKKTSANCKSEDVDDTAYAVQALIAAGSHHAAARGLAYLQKVEHSNGGFGKPENANSTALAIQALVAGDDNSTAAGKWLVHQQVGCSAPASHHGAVKYESKFDSSALLATSQAGAALAGLPLAAISKDGAHKATPTLFCSKK